MVRRGEALITDGAGKLSFATIASGGADKFQFSAAKELVLWGDDTQNRQLTSNSSTYMGFFRLGDPGGTYHFTIRNFWIMGLPYKAGATACYSNWIQVDPSVTTNGVATGGFATSETVKVTMKLSIGIMVIMVLTLLPLFTLSTVVVRFSWVETTRGRSYSSHYFGYTIIGRNRSTGANVNSTYAMTYADHAYNGNYLALSRFSNELNGVFADNGIS